MDYDSKRYWSDSRKEKLNDLPNDLPKENKE
jgi:hypothetical protein